MFGTVTLADFRPKKKKKRTNELGAVTMYTKGQQDNQKESLSIRTKHRPLLLINIIQDNLLIKVTQFC